MVDLAKNKNMEKFQIFYQNHGLTVTPLGKIIIFLLFWVSVFYSLKTQFDFLGKTIFVVKNKNMEKSSKFWPMA